MVDNAYRDKLHKIRAIYDIVNLVKVSKNIDDWRWFNKKKSTKMADLVAALAAAMEDDCRICVQTLAAVHDMSAGTIFNIIHDELGLVKKSARWVPQGAVTMPDEQEDEDVSNVATKLGFPRFAKHEIRRNYFPISRNFAKFCEISRNGF
jgi:hypothetical protein